MYDRVAALIEVGVDFICVDTAHGHSKGVLNTVKELKQKYPDLQVVGGNVATGAGAKALVDVGVNAVKVGVGPGSICTTRIHIPEFILCFLFANFRHYISRKSLYILIKDFLTKYKFENG